MGLPPADAAPPPAIEAGVVHALLVFDVADSIDLDRLQSVAGGGVARAPLALRREASPGSLQFPIPPVAARLSAIEVGGHSARVRAKLYDYGVVSILLSVPYGGDWKGFRELARSLRAESVADVAARGVLDGLLTDIGSALHKQHAPLVEDYFAFEVGTFVEPMSADVLLQRHAPALAELIAGEDARLESDAQAELLRTRFSYFADDLVVVQWDGAFIYDRPDGAAATMDILEFANTQLVELRTYDGLLDAELDSIYGAQTRRTFGPFARKQAVAAAERLRYLIVDVLELTDRSSNALKITGDAFYARLYRAAATRLGLSDWQRQLDSKMNSVNEMYRFFADQAQNARAEFLELIIVVLIGVEIVIGLLSLRH
jgi:hypothetical protein